MTGLQRIQAALQGQPADRRAVAPLLSLYGAKLTGCPLDRYYHDAAAYVHGQDAVRETFAPDLLAAPFLLPLLAECCGGEMTYPGLQPPVVRRPPIHSADQWNRIALPDPVHHPAMRYLLDAIGLMAQRYRDDTPVLAILTPPIDVPILLMGLDAWLETVLFEPDQARRIMQDVVPFTVQWTNACLARGALAVVYPCGMLSPTVVTRQIVETWARPILADALAQINGPAILHHGGAPMLANLDLLPGLPAVAGFVPDERDDLDQARRILGPDPLLLCGPMAPELPRLSAQQVAQRCHALLDNRRDDPRFILCTTGPDVPWDTPPENIHALRRSAEAFAQGGP